MNDLSAGYIDAKDAGTATCASIEKEMRCIAAEILQVVVTASYPACNAFLEDRKPPSVSLILKAG
eukprot:120666-Rhodomonas_salina.3